MKQIMILLLVTGTALALPGSLSGQVGHPPESSPYRPIRARKTLFFTGGRFAGSEGKVGVGPTDGTFLGVKFGYHPGGPVEFLLGLGSMSLDRTIIDPTQGAANRAVGSVSQTVRLWDIGVVLRLTGRKSWHRLAPYVGGTFGIANASDVADTVSGFGFKTQFHYGPQAGFLWILSDKTSLRFEARDVLWRLKYPLVFFQSPANAPNEPPLLNQNLDRRTQWVHHALLTISFGYALGF
ncbi:MAG: hypothetical protein ACE5HT_05910 [Gemmatimonadales bacterium]